MPGVNGKGVVAAVLLALMGGAWWWTLSQPAFRPTTTAAAPLPPRPATSTSAPPEVALHRLRPPAPEPVDRVGRDPFAGGPGPSVTALPPAAQVGRAGEQSGSSSGAAPVPVWPRLELIGIGARTAGATTRVAVLAGERGVVHAGAGDLVWEVYRIDRVQDDAVEVTLLPERRAFTLRLR